MLTKIGHIESIYRYPVKSMAGQQLASASLGWHGLQGDRRLALRRVDDRSGFPFLTAGKLPELILFHPQHQADAGLNDAPALVRTPSGEELPTYSEELTAYIGRRHGSPVQMMHLRSGIFDEGSLSIIASETVREIAGLAGCDPDARMFRPNVVVSLLQPGAFQEDNWVGATISFGESEDSPAVHVTMRDERCSMMNLDPDTARPRPEMLKAVVRVNQNYAGVYANVTRIGHLAVGQALFLRRD